MINLYNVKFYKFISINEYLFNFFVQNLIFFIIYYFKFKELEWEGQWDNFRCP